MQVNTHFTFDLNVQSSSTSGTCDPFPVAGCETYLLFCLRGMRSDRSCNIGNCPLGNHGRINENSLPSMPSISSDSPWPVSLLWGVHVACDLHVSLVLIRSPIPVLTKAESVWWFCTESSFFLLGLPVCYTCSAEIVYVSVKSEAGGLC